MTSTTRTGTSRVAAGLLGLGLAAGLVSGCSGSSSSSATSEQPAAASSSAAAGGAADSAGSRSESAAAKGAVPVPGAGVEVSDQKLVRDATLSLEVKDIAEATAKVRAINLAAGGITLSENIGSYPGETTPKVGVNPSTYAVLVISVPVEKLDTTLDQLQGVGTVLDRRSETQNVTEEYVDVQARVASMKKSVARVQDLIDRTSDIDQLVRLEQELSSRQADLEAIEARLASLDRQTTRSPITVNLATDPALVDQPGDNPAGGFLGGLEKGWKAFVASLVALVTVLGALLPFVLFAALIGVPLLWLWRRARRNRPAGAPRSVTYVSPPAASPPPPAAGEAESQAKEPTPVG